MALMDRIKIKHYLQHTITEQTKMIEDLQQLRITDQIEARAMKATTTKSARKNKRKRGKKVKDPKAALQKLFSQLTQNEIQSLNKRMF